MAWCDISFIEIHRYLKVIFCSEIQVRKLSLPMKITWWIFVYILTLESIAGFDLIQIIDYWIFGSSTHRKILLNIDAQNKFIRERDFIKRRIETLQRDINEINWDIEKKKGYLQNCNFFMAFVVKWIISVSDYRRVEKSRRLEKLIWRQNAEPFCDQYQYSGEYHQHWNSICLKAFEDDYFKNKGWILSSHSRDNTACHLIDAYNIETNSPSNDHNQLLHNRLALQCVVEHDETDLRFNIYLISSITYKPDYNHLSYYVVMENILREQTTNSGIFHDLLKNNNNRNEIAAYIEN